MAEITESVQETVDTKVSVILEDWPDGEEAILSGIESVQTRSNAMRLAVKENLSSVILEPTMGRAWQYSRAGNLVAQNQEISVVLNKSRGTPYALCMPWKGGLWNCSIIERETLIKVVQTRS